MGAESSKDMSTIATSVTASCHDLTPIDPCIAFHLQQVTHRAT